MAQNKIVNSAIPRTAAALIANAYDGSPGTLYRVMTAGSYGAQVNGLSVRPRGNHSGIRVDVGRSQDNGNSIWIMDSVLLPALTISNSAIIAPQVMITPDNPLLLQAGDQLWTYSVVSLAAGIVVFAHFLDFQGT